MFLNGESLSIESIESLFLHNLDAGSLGSSANIDNVIVAIFCLVVRIASVDVDEAIASESSLLDDMTTPTRQQPHPTALSANAFDLQQPSTDTYSQLLALYEEQEQQLMLTLQANKVSHRRAQKTFDCLPDTVDPILTST